MLESVLAPYKNVRLVQGDILKLDPAELMESPGYIVVANIPYYITSMVIRHLLEAERRPSRVVLTVQKEVAERICALRGKNEFAGVERAGLWETGHWSNHPGRCLLPTHQK